MPELVRADPAGDRPEGLSPAAAGDPAAPARSRPHAQLEGGDPRPGGGLARAGAGRRPHDPRPAVRAVRVADEEPAVRRPGALGGAALPCDRQRLRRDDRAGAGRRRRPARAVSDGLQRHGRRGVPEPAPAARRGPPRAGPGRRRGRRSARSPGSSSARGTTTSSPSRPAVLAANPKVRFVFIGDGILRDRLIAETERLGLRHAFHFVGLVPPGRIPELLGAMDAVVHPSLREGLARVLPQALLVGRPVDQLRRRRGPRGRPARDRHPARAPRPAGPRRRDPPAGGRPGAPRTRWAGRAGGGSPISSATRR